MTQSTFEAFGFAEPLTRALAAHDYVTPTPIQVQGLPPQLQNRDILALAETGSGKTATFLLPVLQRFALNPVEPNPRQVMTLILAPTRELALQIDAEVAALSRFMNIRRAVVLGGVSKGPQISALKRGVHILVATPGRLLDHVAERHADLTSVMTLVLDEADRMFDMGFIRDIRKIVNLLPRQRRTALFSATMPTEIRALAHDLLTDPYKIDLSPKQMVVDRIDQKVMIVRMADKQSRLHTLLEDPAMNRVIVFTRTKRGADRVADRLGMAGIGASAIHGNKAQNARQRALHDFSAGHVRVLVATDIAARGIDVSNVSHVVNFDMPIEPETYVHRIGRTARKGESGIAISLCDPGEIGEIKAIERLMKQPIAVIGDCGGAPVAMSERRPHRDHDAPRHEGAHRRGPRQNNRGEGGHHARGERGGERGGERARSHTGHGAAAGAQTASKPRRADSAHGEARGYSPERDRDRDQRGNGGRNGNAAPSDRGGRGQGAHAGGGHAGGKHAGHGGGQPRGEHAHRSAGHGEGGHRSAGHGASGHASSGHGGGHGRPARTSERRDDAGASQNASGHRNERPRTDAGPARSGGANRGNWDGQKPPKFLNRGSGSGGRRPNAKPAA
ncbi:MAG: DEAD/DEAH box helicase [Hyphomicrobium sp.]